MSLRGINQAQQEIKQLQAKIKQAQRAGEKKVADIIAAEARQRAPGSLANGIVVTQTENETIIDGGGELAAYGEFGTGRNAEAYLSTQPTEVVNEALKFFVNGTGRTPAQPFFFPPIMANKDKIVPAVEAELQKISK